jgi:hypothetical protein
VAAAGTRAVAAVEAWLRVAEPLQAARAPAVAVAGIINDCRLSIADYQAALLLLNLKS